MTKLILFGLLASSLMADVDPERLLAAIAEVETGSQYHRIGRSGERSQFQVLPATWGRFSPIDPSKARQNEVLRVCRAILTEIRTALERRGLPLTPFNYALRWNAGSNAKTFSSHTRTYAEHVTNLYEARTRHQGP